MNRPALTDLRSKALKITDGYAAYRGCFQTSYLASQYYPIIRIRLPLARKHHQGRISAANVAKPFE